MISRQLLITRGLPRHLELHKGKPLPLWFSQILGNSSETTAWWQVYLDNFMSAERITGSYKMADVELQEKAMQAWISSGVLTAEDKQVLSAKTGVELGVRLDGIEGLLGGSPLRVLKTCFVTLHLLMQKSLSKRDIQVVLGRWIFLLIPPAISPCSDGSFVKELGKG